MQQAPKLWAGYAGGLLVETPRPAYDLTPKGMHNGPIDWHPVKVRAGFVDKVGPVVAVTFNGKEA